MQELVTRLAALCQAKGVEKFSAEEIVELLSDGEEVDWIVDQVLPAEAEADRSEMSQVLAEIAAAVAPAPARGYRRRGTCLGRGVGFGPTPAVSAARS